MTYKLEDLSNSNKKDELLAACEEAGLEADASMTKEQILQVIADSIAETKAEDAEPEAEAPEAEVAEPEAEEAEAEAAEPEAAEPEAAEPEKQTQPAQFNVISNPYIGAAESEVDEAMEKLKGMVRELNHAAEAYDVRPLPRPSTVRSGFSRVIRR